MATIIFGSIIEPVFIEPPSSLLFLYFRSKKIKSCSSQALLQLEC